MIRPLLRWLCYFPRKLNERLTKMTNRKKSRLNFGPATLLTVEKQKSVWQTSSALWLLVIIMTSLGGVLLCDVILHGDVTAQSPRHFISELSRRQREAFQPKLNMPQKSSLLHLMENFHSALTKNNNSITYFLTFGSLLGSYRHHDLIPWSDRISVMVPKDESKRLISAVASHPDMEMSICGTGLRISPASRAPQLKKQSWVPVLDVHYFTYNLSHVTLLVDRLDNQQDGHLNLDLTQRNRTQSRNLNFNQQDVNCSHKPHDLKRRPLSLPKEVVFPAVGRPLGAGLYPAPRDPRLFLTLLGYEIDRCVASYSNSSQEERIDLHFRSEIAPSEKVADVSCLLLSNTSVPLVSHYLGPWKSWCMEDLSVRSKIIRSFLRSAKDIVTC